MYDFLKQVLCHANKHTAPELPEEVRKSNAKRILSVVTEIIRISNVARREGLLAMEEYSEKYISERSPEDIFLKKAVEYIVDGTDPEFVRDILGATILVCGMETLQGYLDYICMEGMLSIQAGENPRIIREKLLACLPLNMQIEAKQALERVEGEWSSWSEKKERLYIEVYNSAEARALFLSILEEKILHLTEEQLIHTLERVDIQQLGAFLPKAREEVRALLFRYLSKEQIQGMLEDTFSWHSMSLAEALAGMTELFQQLERNGII